MALLDALFQPLEYMSANQGLLSRIPEWMIQPGQSQGFPGATAPAPVPTQAPMPALPANAAPTSGQLPSQPQQFGGPLGGLLGGLFGSSPANAAPLSSGQDLGIGDRLSAGLSGFANSRGILPAISNLIQGVTTGQRSDPQGMMLQQQRATFQALVGSGVPPATAMAAALNPEVMKTVAPQIYQKPQLVNGGTDPLTGEITHQLYDPNTQTLKPLAPGGAAGGSMQNSLQTSFDKITQQREAGAPPDQLLQNIPVAYREGVRALIDGRNIPSNMSFKGAARTAALMWAHAIDPTFDETIIPQRQQFAKGMASTSPSSPGGQKVLLNTALGHAGEMADALAELGNTNGPFPSIPGSAYLAHGINNFNNSSSEKGNLVNKIADIGQKLSGEVGKLYSGSSGGGEAERMATAERFSTAKTPSELAGALEATRDLLYSRLYALENQRDQAYGKAGENIYPFVDQSTKAAIAKIDSAIAKLRGGAAAPAHSATSAAAPAGQNDPLGIR